MLKINWKSLLLLTAVVLSGALVLVSGMLATVRLPLLGWTGVAPLVILVAITLVFSRFTVPVTNVDGSSESNKSVADAFIFSP